MDLEELKQEHLKTENRKKAEPVQHLVISTAVAEGQKRQLEKAELTADLVKEAIRRSVYAQAYGDFRRFFTPGGQLRRIVDLTADDAAQLAGFEVIIKNAAAGDGHTDTIHKIRLRSDYAHFTELAAKHLGMLVDKVELTNWDEMIRRLDKGLARADGEA